MTAECAYCSKRLSVSLVKKPRLRKHHCNPVTGLFTYGAIKPGSERPS